MLILCNRELGILIKGMRTLCGQYHILILRTDYFNFNGKTMKSFCTSGSVAASRFEQIITDIAHATYKGPCNEIECES